MRTARRARNAALALVVGGVFAVAAPAAAFGVAAASDPAPLAVTDATTSTTTSTTPPPLAVEPHPDPPQPPQPSGDVRVAAAIAGTPDGTAVVLYGGGGPLLGGPTTTPLADTWVWDGEHWTAKCGTSTPGADAPCAPGPRQVSAAGTGRSGVVLYGGLTDTGTGGVAGADTWVWDGSGWTRVCSTCAPGKRFGSAAAGNGTDVLLFGGLTDLPANPGAALVNDTWSFDGTTWTPLDAGGSGRPAPRVLASMAWDGRHFVLFGGFTDFSGSDSPPADDTWIWTDAGWVQACGAPLEPCGPKARFLAGFAYLASPDASREGALLGGGLGFDSGGKCCTVLGDLWFWNGSRYIKQASPWPDETVATGGLPVGLVGFGMLGSRPAACQVTMVATQVLATGTVTRTFDIGFDANGDGHPDPCPASTPAAQPHPVTGGLPVTGSNLHRDALVGLGAVLAGIGLVVSTRRARPASPRGGVSRASGR